MTDNTAPATSSGRICGVCRGPVRAYAGSQWKWTCRACIRKALLGENYQPPQTDPPLPLLSRKRSKNSVINGARLDDAE